MSQAASHRSTITNLVVRNVFHSRIQQGMRLRQLPVIFDVAPSDLCAEFDTGFVDQDLIEVRNTLEINQQIAGRETEGQHRYEALTAAQNLRIWLMLL